jgi:Tfp pilus assembly protein PilN
MQTAIGLAISGREVRLATLASHKGRVSVTGLDTIYLDTSLEYHLKEEKVADNTPNTDTKDVFGLKDGWDDKSADGGSQKQGDTNLEILYKFLFRHVPKKTKIALNIPVSMAKYQRLDSAEFKQAEDFPEKANSTGTESGFGSEQHLLKLADGATISLVHDQYPPFLNILREVNDFLGKKLYFGAMDTTEMALANIARSSRYTDHGKITVIVYIEDDFTRLIFLDGYELLHISSIINENAASPQILDVISRRLMYEIDEAKIPEISSILLAGRCSRIRAKAFFAEQFGYADVDYLSTFAVGHLPVEQEKQEERFSEFAVAIALAWKQLQPKDPDFFPLNLIPQDLRDQQEILKLDRYGYAMLALTGLIAFLITFQIISVRSEVRNMQMKNLSLEQEIKHTREAVDDVLDLEDERQQLETNLSLADSLAKEHNAFLVFLKKLNASVQYTGDVWINQISKSGATYSLNGSSKSRLKIPILADKLGGATLKKVTREKSGQSQLYHFSMDGIQSGKDGEPASEGLSLANFTTLPSFSRDSFAGNIRPAQPRPVTSGRVSQRTNGRSSNGSSRTYSQANKVPASRAKTVNGTFKQQYNNTHVAKKPRSPSGTRRYSERSNGIAKNYPQNASNNRPDKAKSSFQARSLANDMRSNPAIRYFIEVAQSDDRNFAEKYAAACRKKGLRASVVSYFDRNKGKQSYRIVLGNYPSRSNAERAYALLSDALGAAAMKSSRIITLAMPANN